MSECGENGLSIPLCLPSCTCLSLYTNDNSTSIYPPFSSGEGEPLGEDIQATTPFNVHIHFHRVKFFVKGYALIHPLFYFPKEPPGALVRVSG